MILPEVVLGRALANGFKTLRNDPKIIDTLFKNLTQQQLSNLKNSVLTQPISVAMNYPKVDALTLPALILTLKNESEAQPFLGNHMGTTPDYGLPEEFGYDMLGTGSTVGSTSDTAGLGKLVSGPLDIESASSSTVTISEDSLAAFTVFVESLHQYNSGSYILYVIEGPGSGYSYPILRITNNTIDIEDSFVVGLTNQSRVAIRDGATVYETVGESSRILGENSVATRSGVNYESLYQLEVLSSSQSEVLYLYALVKAILISQTPFLEGQGIQALKISGSDFAPKSEYLPTDCFARALTLNFTYGFALVEELANPTRIDVIIYPNDEDGLEIATIVI